MSGRTTTPQQEKEKGTDVFSGDAQVTDILQEILAKEAKKRKPANDDTAEPGQMGENAAVFCHVNPCMNGGRCKENRRTLTYKCDCPAAFSGKHCGTFSQRELRLA